jgi:hypothetical protein
VAAAETHATSSDGGIASLDGLAELCGKVPLPRTLYEHFRERIMAGEYGVGSRMPTVRAVADRVRSTPETAAVAYRMLAADGLVRTRKGAGTVVLGRPSAAARPGACPAILVPALDTPSYHETYRWLLQLDREPRHAARATSSAGAVPAGPVGLFVVARETARWRWGRNVRGCGRRGKRLEGASVVASPNVIDQRRAGRPGSSSARSWLQ